MWGKGFAYAYCYSFNSFNEYPSDCAVDEKKAVLHYAMMPWDSTSAGIAVIVA
jgi:lipopolysaccharide biosynthesis glycosyltransferase